MGIDTSFALLAFVIAFFGTSFLRKYALNLGLTDEPNHRSSHAVAMPRGGGVAVVASFSVFLLLAGFFGINTPLGSLAVLIPAWAVAVAGLIDDLGHLSAGYRLLVHFVASAVVLSVLASGHSVLSSIPMWLTLALGAIALVSMVWLVNLFNFMDGIDGIVALEVLSVCASAFILLAINDGLAIAGFPIQVFFMAMAGFCFWNFPKAEIFMGDVGSGFVGFVMALFILITTSNGLLSVFVWLILLAVFWVDATYTLLRRLVTGQNIAQAHRSHAYQILASRWGAHWKVSCTVAAVNLLWLFPLAALTNLIANVETGFWKATFYASAVLVIAVLPLIFVQVRLGAGEKACQKDYNVFRQT
ncbi:MAG: glycosyl transferase [Proteobacteria bacterium]|nr:MAG: glycosyl transferase [Pseudomonadota bacterium]PIE39877.1 MAG: glycosyl transferase [Gammaproteobacteria bacterium]